MHESLHDFNAVEPVPGSVNPRHLRLWCAPEAILIVTNIADERTVLQEALKQAKRSSAKILLAYVVRPAGPRPLCNHNGRPGWCHSPAHRAQLALDRMVRQLRWAGVPSEPVLLQGLPAEEIPQLVRLRGVNRVIVTTQTDPNARGITNRAIAEQILPRVGVPVCVLGASLRSESEFAAPIQQVTLALSPQMNCEVLLSFACQFAAEHQARLRVLHVLPEGETVAQVNRGAFAGRPSKDPIWLLREAQSRYPFETVLREGNLADEILAQVARREQDCIILSSDGIAPGETSEAMRITNRIANDARCPILVLGSAITHPAGVAQRVHAAAEEENDGIQASAPGRPDLPIPIASSLLPMRTRAAQSAGFIERA